MRYVRFSDTMDRMRSTLAVWLGDNKDDRMTVSKALMRFRDLACSEKLDRIYALWSLMDWSKHRSTIKVDYEISPMVLAKRVFATWPDTLPADVHNMNFSLDLCRNLVPSLIAENSEWIYNTLTERCVEYVSHAAKLYSTVGTRSLDAANPPTFDQEGVQLRSMVPLRIETKEVITHTTMKDLHPDELPRHCCFIITHPPRGTIGTHETRELVHSTFATAPQPGDVIFMPGWILACPWILARPSHNVDQYTIVGFLTPFSQARGKVLRTRRDAYLSTTEQYLGFETNTYLHVDADDMLVMIWLYKRLYERNEPLKQSCFTPRRAATDNILQMARKTLGSAVAGLFTWTEP